MGKIVEVIGMVVITGNLYMGYVLVISFYCFFFEQTDHILSKSKSVTIPDITYEIFGITSQYYKF